MQSPVAGGSEVGCGRELRVGQCGWSVGSGELVVGQTSRGSIPDRAAQAVTSAGALF